MAFGGRPPATTSLSTSSSDPQELPIDPSLLNVTPGKGYINLSSSSPATITPPQAVRISSGSPLSGSGNIAPTRVESPTFDSPNITPIRVESATIDPPKRHSDTHRVLQQPWVLRRRYCFGLTHYSNSPLYPCRPLLAPQPPTSTPPSLSPTSGPQPATAAIPHSPSPPPANGEAMDVQTRPYTAPKSQAMPPKLPMHGQDGGGRGGGRGG